MTMTTTKLDLDLHDTVHHLDAALDAILTIRLALGGLPALPHHGLDRALMDDEYQAAKERARQAWAPIIEKAGDTKATFAAEEAVHQWVVKAAELGWRMAMAAGAGRR